MLNALRVAALSIALGLSLYAVGAINAPGRVTATCASNHITLYVDAGGSGSPQSFCLESLGNLNNLDNIPGPCAHFLGNTSWNDCVSSVRVSLGGTQCFATYSNAGFSGLMATYWGAESEVLHSPVSPNDAMSSIKQYNKVPNTPAGNC